MFKTKRPAFSLSAPVARNGAHLGKTLALAVGLLCSPGFSIAAPPDFRVLTDDISAPGSKDFEFQASIAKPSPETTPGSGRVFQGLGEFSYGVAKNWEISLQLPVARVNGNWYANGINAELQYIAPHDEDEGFYWGARTELGYVSPVGDDSSWQAEFRPVIGYHTDDWHVVLNPAITVALTGEDRKVKFEPATKWMYQINKANAIGLEYFWEAGPLSHILPRSQRDELALLVMDSKVGKFDLNFGLGRGMTGVSDRWVAKLILSTSLD